MIKHGLQIFACNASRELACDISNRLGLRPGRIDISRFSNDNLRVQIQENVRERDVFVVQSFTEPVSEHIMELMITLDALRSASAQRITAVIPYYSYARSDKKDAPRISITGRLIADLLQTAGANRVLTMDLHADQVHGFFSVPVDHLTAVSLIAEHFRSWATSDDQLDLICSTGGTGLSPRDVTPEATRDVIDREAPGFAEEMRRRSAERFPRAILSRGVAGTLGRCLVLNLPGSPSGAVECLDYVAPVLAHAVKVLGGGVRDCKDDAPRGSEIR